MTGGVPATAIGGSQVIRLESLSYVYPGPPPVEALKSVHLSVSRGDHVALSGPGCWPGLISRCGPAPSSRPTRSAADLSAKELP
jgi:hypothetical protein